MENCQLTFGVGQCVGMSATQNCPNSYTINGQKFCVLKSTSGSGSSAGSGTASGNSGSSGSASKGECDPTAKSYDECMGRNKTPDGTVTAKIKSDLETAANKALDDYTKSRNEDLDNTKRDGIDFKSAPDSLRSSVLALIPSYRTCQNVTFTFFKTTKTLDCALFEKFKLIMAWFCSIATAIYIFKLAVKPVER
jgi:hypothetical protein